jgi:NitT/TauT family transport system permease protein
MSTSKADSITPTTNHMQSPGYRKYLADTRFRSAMIHCSQALLLAVFLAGWELVAKSGWVNPMLISYPSALWPTFVTMVREMDLLNHVLATIWSTVIGFTVSMLLGTFIAALLWWSPFAYKVLDPFFVVANAVPKIALVPIFYIWLGARTSIYAMAVAIALFITILMMYNGFKSIDANRIKLARTFGASQWQILTKVVMPGSIPTLISTLKAVVGLTLVGVIVGEFQSANVGLGYLIIYGGQIFKLNIVMTAIAILSVISALMFIAIHYLESAVIQRFS